MNSNLELFECQTFITVLELESQKPKKLFVRLQLNEIPPINLGQFETAEGDARVNLYSGVKYLARLECFTAFQVCPVYIYLSNAQNQVVGACGFDLGPMIVDAYRHSIKGVAETVNYQINLAIQNQWDQVIGNAHFEFAVRHFSHDLSQIFCYEEIAPAPQADGEEMQEDEGDGTGGGLAHAQTSTRRRRKMMVVPRLADLLLLNRRYYRTRGKLVDEMRMLEHEVKKIETSKKRQKMKRIQEVKRKLEAGQFYEPESTTYTSSFDLSVDSMSSSDSSRTKRMKDTFNEVEQLSGPRYPRHRSQKHEERRKEHRSHRHHHHEDESDDPRRSSRRDSMSQARTAAPSKEQKEPFPKMVKTEHGHRPRAESTASSTYKSPEQRKSRKSKADNEAFFKRQDEAAKHKAELAKQNAQPQPETTKKSKPGTSTTGRRTSKQDNDSRRGSSILGDAGRAPEHKTTQPKKTQEKPKAEKPHSETVKKPKETKTSDIETLTLDDKSTTDPKPQESKSKIDSDFEGETLTIEDQKTDVKPQESKSKIDSDFLGTDTLTIDDPSGKIEVKPQESKSKIDSDFLGTETLTIDDPSGKVDVKPQESKSKIDSDFLGTETLTLDDTSKPEAKPKKDESELGGTSTLTGQIDVASAVDILSDIGEKPSEHLSVIDDGDNIDVESSHEPAKEPTAPAKKSSDEKLESLTLSDFEDVISEGKSIHDEPSITSVSDKKPTTTTSTTAASTNKPPSSESESLSISGFSEDDKQDKLLSGLPDDLKEDLREMGIFSDDDDFEKSKPKSKPAAKPEPEKTTPVESSSESNHDSVPNLDFLTTEKLNSSKKSLFDDSEFGDSILSS